MIELLFTYKYLILIPLSIIEGPIITVVCGFLVTLKIFNPFIVYIIMVIGDVIGDGFIYYLGFKGQKYVHFFRVNDIQLEKAKTYFANNHHKALLMSKLIHGLGFTGLLAAGASHVPYKKYFKTCLAISAVQSLVMLIIGIVFGHAYTLIGKYLNYYAAFVSVAALVGILIYSIKKYPFKTKMS